MKRILKYTAEIKDSQILEIQSLNILSAME